MFRLAILRLATLGLLFLIAGCGKSESAPANPGTPPAGNPTSQSSAASPASGIEAPPSARPNGKKGWEPQ